MQLEIGPDSFPDWLRRREPCRHRTFQGIDLRPHDAEMASLPQARDPSEACVFLGCELGPLMAAAAAVSHALVFPELPGRPYQPFRHRLYSVEEIFDGFNPEDPDSYRNTPDWLIYRSYLKVDPNNRPYHPAQFVPVGPAEILARRLHDHFVGESLRTALKPFTPDGGGRGVVAVMGGHDRRRSDPLFLQVARLARQLTLEGYLVASGGGPGLMEATNLGAFFADHSELDLEQAIQTMARPGADAYSDPEWLKAAWEVRSRFSGQEPRRGRSLGIPTWFYGHEPPNIFSSMIAKYFENSLREEGLLAIASHGVIFAEGNAGTVQEIFQDACQNYYQTYGFRSPMILLGRASWDPASSEMSDDRSSPDFGNKPAWPLLSKLARMKGFTDRLTLTDDPEQALEVIRNFREPGQLG
jgi:predicted Rossmann-fold nucleotide-binding protein